MDAARKLIRKTSFPLAMAVLFAAPALAQLQVSTNDVTLPSAGQLFANVSVTTAAGSPVTFTVAKAAGDGFYSVQALSGGTTPDTVQVTLLTSSAFAQNGSFTITNNANVADKQTVAVHYVPGGVGGGSNLITATPNPLTIAVPSGGSTIAYATLSTTNSTPVQFTTAVTTGTFITGVSASQYTISSGSAATLTLNINAGALANGTYPGSITITPTGGAAVVLNVSLTVGSGGGSTTYQFTNGLAYTFAYPVGTQFAFTPMTSTNSAVTTFNATPSVSWLLANGTTQAFNQLVTSGLSISLSNVAGTLATGTYTGSIVVQNPTNAADQTSISVTLSVNQGTLPNLTVTPSNSFTFNVASGAGQTDSQINLSAPSATTIQSVTPSTSTGSGWLVAFTNSSTLPATITARIFPSLLAAGTYNGSVSVIFAGGVNGTQTFPVTVTVGSGGGGGGTVNGVGPTSLSFFYQTGSNAFVPQQAINVSGSGAVSVGTIVVSEPTQWISATATGPAPSEVIVGVIPSGLSAGVHTATVPIITSSGTTNVTVNLTVGSGVVLYSNPSTINVTDQASPTASTQVTLSTSDNSSLAFTAVSSASWVTLNTPSSTTTPSSLIVSMNTAGLPAGVNTATVTVTAAGAANNPLIIPVVATVTNGSSGTLTLSSSSLTFNAVIGAAAPASQTLSVTAATATNFTASATIQSGGTNWLTISPSGSLTTNQSLTVSVNQTGLAAGTYNATIALVTNGITQSVPVSLVVTGGSITVSPTTLSFTSNTNTSQAVSVTSATSGISTISYTVGATTASGGAWLSASATTGVTPSSFNAVVNSAGLATGTYQGTITVTPSSGPAVTIGVTLNVTTLNVTATTANGTTLNFTYRVGDAAPLGQAISVGGGTGASFSATAASTGNWLSVAPTTGVTPATIQASVNPTGLSAGTYNGTVTVAGTGGATGSSTISVALTVTAPLPTISTGGVTNAASYLTGAISPGEIITIFGTAIGPTAAVGLTLDASGNVSTTLGGVQVLVNGFPAPMIFASDKQVSAVVPYEIAPFLTATVQIKYLGQSSNGVNVQVAATAPGVFTANRTGTGPASAIDATQGPTSLNGPSNPAAHNDVITMYVTGEGLTNPAVTGRVTPSTTPFTLPLLPPTVLVDGFPAQVNFYGEAPSYTSGLMQINFVVPAGARSTDVSLVVRIGGVDSQPGVTLSVK